MTKAGRRRERAPAWHAKHSAGVRRVETMSTSLSTAGRTSSSLPGRIRASPPRIAAILTGSGTSRSPPLFPGLRRFVNLVGRGAGLRVANVCNDGYRFHNVDELRDYAATKLHTIHADC